MHRSRATPAAGGGRVPRQLRDRDRLPRRERRREGRPPPPGERQRRGIELGQGGRLGKQVGQTAAGIVDRLSVSEDQGARHASARRLSTPAGRARPAARAPPDRRYAALCGPDLRRPKRPDWIAAELLVDGDRIGIEIEQPPATTDRHGQVSQIAEDEAALDVFSSRRERNDRTAVEGANAGEARPESGLRHRQRRGLDQQPRRLSALGAGDRQRTGTELGTQVALHLSGAVAQAARQFADAAAINHSVGDQSHGASHEIGLRKP